MAKESLIAHALRGVRAVGLSNTVQVALYPLRRAYYEAKFSAGDGRGSVMRGLEAVLRGQREPPRDETPPSRDWTSAGAVLSCTREGQVVTVFCQNAALQLTILAPDLLRVRLSSTKTGQDNPAGASTPCVSYAVAKTDAQWAAAAYTLTETADAFEIRTERLTCRIATNPCQVSFWDGQGQFIHGDTAGLAWQGHRVARFSALVPGERVYGLGERAFPLNLRPQIRLSPQLRVRRVWISTLQDPWAGWRS